MGDDVVVSSDGTTALVSASSGNGRRGASYVFHVSGEGAWTSSSAPAATLTDSGSQRGDGLASAIALSPDGTTALLGAPYVRYETGAADVFHIADPASWATTSTPNAVLTDAALDTCLVPKLVGLTVPAATAALTARSCKLGKVTKVKQPKTKRGTVVAQSVKAGTRMTVGAKVAVQIEK